MGAHVPRSAERQDEAARASSRASGALSRARAALASDEFGPEYRKAVARQMAGLLREDSDQRLDAIAERGNDPELRETVSRCKEDVARATRYIIRRFAEARSLQTDEVRKARTEAIGILERNFVTMSATHGTTHVVGKAGPSTRSFPETTPTTSVGTFGRRSRQIFSDGDGDQGTIEKRKAHEPSLRGALPRRIEPTRARLPLLR